MAKPFIDTFCKVCASIYDCCPKQTRAPYANRQELTWVGPRQPVAGRAGLNNLLLNFSRMGWTKPDWDGPAPRRTSQLGCLDL